jgi:hypothetical protein
MTHLLEKAYFQPILRFKLFLGIFEYRVGCGGNFFVIRLISQQF